MTTVKAFAFTSEDSALSIRAKMTGIISVTASVNASTPAPDEEGPTEYYTGKLDIKTVTMTPTVNTAITNTLSTVVCHAYDRYSPH